MHDEEDTYSEPSVCYINVQDEPTQYADLSQTAPYLYVNEFIEDPSAMRNSVSNPIYSCVTEVAKRTIIME